MKRGLEIHQKDLKALQIFGREYPEAKLLFLYLGKERRKIQKVDCIPISEFLIRLHSDRDSLD